MKSKEIIEYSDSFSLNRPKEVIEVSSRLNLNDVIIAHSIRICSVSYVDNNYCLYYMNDHSMGKTL